MKCPEWCGLCYAGRRGRAYYPGHAGHGSRKKERKGHAMGMLKRPVLRESAGLSCLPNDSPLARSYPALWEFLTLEKWDDGTSRVTGTVRLFAEDGLVKCCANDRDGVGRVCWFSGEALEDVLASLDNALATGEGEWRLDKYKAPAGGRGRRQ